MRQTTENLSRATEKVWKLILSRPTGDCRKNGHITPLIVMKFYKHYLTLYFNIVVWRLYHTIHFCQSKNLQQTWINCLPTQKAIFISQLSKIISTQTWHRVNMTQRVRLLLLSWYRTHSGFYIFSWLFTII